MKQSALIEIKRVENRGRGGRGVFALSDIEINTIIEEAPCIIMSTREVFPKGFNKNTKTCATISWYTFSAPEEGKTALALGYVSLYNHSFNPNAEYDFPSNDIIRVTARKAIKKGEEIFINYNGDPEDKQEVEFNVNL